jgi:hypothetical protein
MALEKWPAGAPVSPRADRGNRVHHGCSSSSKGHAAGPLRVLFL